jgi:hypothetical protein
MKVKKNLLSVIASLALLSVNVNASQSAWEAVEDYSAVYFLSDLPKTIDEGQKFENAINNYGGSGWSNKFHYTNDSAWEDDFKDPVHGGDDGTYADSVDLILFAGHGSQDGFYFNSLNDDHLLHYSDAKWGNNNNLEWIIIDACEVLNNHDNQIQYRWANGNVFNKLHYILGYSSTTYDKDTRGEDFIKYGMYYDWRVSSSWWKATVISENGTTAAYLYAEGSSSNTANDHLWGHGYTSPDPTGPLTLYYSTWGT